MVRELALNEIEAKRLSELLVNLQRAEHDLRLGFTMLLAQFGLENASFQSLSGTVLRVEVPEKEPALRLVP